MEPSECEDVNFSLQDEQLRDISTVQCGLCGKSETIAHNFINSKVKQILINVASVDSANLNYFNDSTSGFCEDCRRKVNQLEQVADHLEKLRRALILCSNALVLSLRREILKKCPNDSVMSDNDEFQKWNSKRVESMLRKFILKNLSGSSRKINGMNQQAPQIIPGIPVQVSHSFKNSRVGQFQDFRRCLRSASQPKEVTSAPNGQNAEAQPCEFLSFDPQVSDQHDDTEIKSPGSSSFLCDVCGKLVRSKSTLQKHLAVHRNGENICHVCDRILSSRSSLQAHLRLHSGERPFQCPHCSLNFIQKISLSQHMKRSHSKSTLFNCSHCSAGFNYQAALRQHQATAHPDLGLRVKPFSCKLCWKGFETSEQLNEHHACAHERHKCKLCGRQFKMSSHLKEHQLRHASVRPFSCTICPSDTRKSFIRRKALLDHIKSSHPHADHHLTADKLPAELILQIQEQCN